ncbi:MAG: hypothetical protein ACYC06_06750 [Ilumatobacteraceae bacterium]
MFTTGSKYFLGIGTLAAIAIGVSLFFVHPSALAVTVLIGLFGAVGLLAGVVLYARDGDVTGDEMSASSHPAPTASMWPLLTAVGAALLLLGTITQVAIFLLGIVVLVGAFVEWTVLAWSERASSDDAFNAAARKRLLNPIEFPVLGAVGLGLLIFSFSRVMLAVDKQVGVALFIIIGALLLVGGVLFAVRTTLQRSVVAAICVIAAIGIVAAGIASARSGMRSELEIAKYERDHEVGRECGAKPSMHSDKGATQTISAKSGVIATVEFVGGKLIAHVQGIKGEQSAITISRSNPSSIIFRNHDPGDFRLVAHLGTKKVTEGVVEDVVSCTQMISRGAEQLLTFSIPKPSVANGPYTLSVAGVDGQDIELVVP